MAPAEIAQLKAVAGRFLHLGRYADAEEAYRRLLQHAPDTPDAWYNLGYIQRVMRQFDQALDSYEKAIAHGLLKPEEAYINRAAILSEHLFCPDAAERELITALTLDRSSLDAWLNLGQIREDRNDLTGAREAYSTALTLSPNNGRAHARLAAMDIFSGEAAMVVARLKTPLQSVGDAANTAELEFAMASALDALGHYDAAFLRFTRANELAWAASSVRYEPKAQEQLIDAIIAAFPAPRNVPRTEHRQPFPLFICGMFRSGSTLCEQTLARHSKVTAGGELDEITAIANVALAPYPLTLSSMPSVQITELCNKYLDRIKKLFPHAQIVTDKRPDNFLYVGLIKTLFPAAKVIITERNPIDNILSIFFLYFADSVSYSSRLSDIIHYYLNYRRLIAHWKTLYPDIVVFDYDAFVAKPKAGAAALLSSCGLEWETNCNPSRTVTSIVRTATAWQVRQPIHSRSVERWRNYSTHITDLVAVLTRFQIK